MEAKDIATTATSNSDILAFLKTMKQTQCTKADLSKLNNAVSGKIDTLQSEVVVNKVEIDALNKRLNDFEATNILSTFNHELSKQRQLRNNLSIMGIPPSKDEKP